MPLILTKIKRKKTNNEYRHKCDLKYPTFSWYKLDHKLEVMNIYKLHTKMKKQNLP